jgi:ribosomal protein L32
MRKYNLSADAFLKAVDAITAEKKQQVRTDAANVTPKAPENKSKQRPVQKPKKQARHYPAILSCPKCGEVAYAQPICPNCAKGRAGIKRQYICGECNFAFYLD